MEDRIRQLEKQVADLQAIVVQLTQDIDMLKQNVFTDSVVFDGMNDFYRELFAKDLKGGGN